MVRLTKRTEVNIMQLVKYSRKFFASKLSKTEYVYNAIKIIDGVAYNGRLNTVLNYTRQRMLMPYGKYIELYNALVKNPVECKKLLQLNGRKMFSRSVIDLFGLIVQTLRFLLSDRLNISDFKRELKFFISALISTTEHKLLNVFWQRNNFDVVDGNNDLAKTVIEKNPSHQRALPLVTPIHRKQDLDFYLMQTKIPKPLPLETHSSPNAVARTIPVVSPPPPREIATTNIYIELSILNTTNISVSINQSLALHENGMQQMMQNVNTLFDFRNNTSNIESVPVTEIPFSYYDTSQIQDSITSMNILKRRVPDKSNYSTLVICNICQNNGVNCIIKCGHSFCVDCVRKFQQDGKGMVKCALCTGFDYCSWIYL